MLLPVLVMVTLACAACDSNDEDGEDLGPAVATDVVTIAYEGRLADGTVFDQSDEINYPLRGFVPGFRDGVVGMMVGETRTFDVPPEEGYGEDGLTDPDTGEVLIPPGATLTFEVTLLGIG